MRDLKEYLRAYRAFVLANLGWPKTLISVVVWLAGVFVPLWAKAFLVLPNWLAFALMIGWALAGDIFAPYGMWKHQRSQLPNTASPDRR